MTLKRIKQIFLILNIPLILLIIIFIISFFDFHLPFSSGICAMHDFLHIYCPGCGGTRAVIAFLNFKFITSFLSNPCVLYFFSIFLYSYITFAITIIKHNGRLYFELRDWMIWSALFIVVGFFILRNLLLIIWGIDYLGDLQKFWI